MASNTGITISYVVSLIGGLIVLIFSTINVVWFSYGAPTTSGYGSYMTGAMDGYHNFMGSYAASTGFLASLSLVGAICGTIVLMSAIIMAVNPRQSLIWAIIIIVFSAVSFVGMGGYFIGAILSIIGGAFALNIRQVNP